MLVGLLRPAVLRSVTRGREDRGRLLSICGAVLRKLGDTGTIVLLPLSAFIFVTIGMQIITTSRGLQS